MSGGFVKEDGLKRGEHQVVIFTFKGPIEQTKCAEWNLAVEDLKQTFGNQVIGVTMNGMDTPADFRHSHGVNIVDATPPMTLTVTAAPSSVVTASAGRKRTAKGAKRTVKNAPEKPATKARRKARGKR